MKQVKSMAHLKELTADDPVEFHLVLNGGLYSRKTISFGGGTFLVWNHIDDTERELTEAQLIDRSYSNVGYAIEQGALVY
jgi:hypothetical protein